MQSTKNHTSLSWMTVKPLPWNYQLFADRTRVTRDSRRAISTMSLLRASKLSWLLMEKPRVREWWIYLNVHTYFSLRAVKKPHSRIYYGGYNARRIDIGCGSLFAVIYNHAQSKSSSRITGGIRPRGFLRVLNNRMTKTRGCIWLPLLPALYTFFRPLVYARKPTVNLQRARTLPVLFPSCHDQSHH